MSINPDQIDFLDQATAAAKQATCPFPQMVACEAALESGYGASKLAEKYNNLFGMKEHLHNIYGKVRLPTKEFMGGEWAMVGAEWEVYPDWATCFFDRLNTLIRLQHAYPHYAAALVAEDAESYVREVSKTWSTDPARADKVISIYHEYARS